MRKAFKRTTLLADFRWGFPLTPLQPFLNLHTHGRFGRLEVFHSCRIGTALHADHRSAGKLDVDCGAIVRAMRTTHKRNGTLNLFAALEIASGQVFAQTTEEKKREDFRRFLDAVLAELPTDKEIHVILDNYCTHKRNADWLDKY
jgi:hypothetical protein